MWLDGEKVADKAGGEFPTTEEVVAAVRARLNR